MAYHWHKNMSLPNKLNNFSKMTTNVRIIQVIFKLIADFILITKYD